MSYPYADLIRQDILRMIPPDGTTIGSIGCGGGATEAVLVGQGRQVHGVDIAPEAIALAQPRLTSARLIAPHDPAPFLPASLDGLILADILEHLPHAWLALASYVRAVRPGGWVVISVPNMRSFPILHRFFLHGDWPEDSAGLFDATHLQVMSHRRLTRWCAAAGLRIDRWFDSYPPYRPHRYHQLDRLTFRLFHTWFTYQLQVLCRKLPATSADSAASRSRPQP